MNRTILSARGEPRGARRWALALLVLCVVTLLAVGTAGVGVASADQTGDTLEPNDDRDSAVVVDGDAADWDGLSIHDETDEDYVAVEAEAGETITVEMRFAHEAGDLDLALQDADGLELADSMSISDDESIEYTVEEAGTYYVRAYGWAGATNEYDLTVTVNESTGDDEWREDDSADYEPDTLESNDSPEAATVVDGDAADWSALTVHDETDEDYVAIEAEAGETISADMTFSDDEGDLDLALQDADGLELADSVSISDDESIEYTVEESGTYYVRAYGWAGATNEYDLSVTVDESTGDEWREDDPADYEPDTLEPNDDRDAAEVVDGDADSWTGLTIHDETDEDYVAVEAEAGETITAEMTFSDDEGDLDLALQDGAGLELADSMSISDDESIEYTVEESGTYYVRAYGWAGATAEYDLTVTVDESTGDDEWRDEDTADYEPDTLESNDSPEAATVLDGDADSWTGLTIHDETDEDYVAVEAEAGETITAEMSFSDDEGDLDLALQDADGLELADSVSISDDESIEYTVEEAGTYYVRAYGWAGATAEYDLSVTVNESTGDDEWRDEDTADYEPDALEPNDDRDSAVVVDGDADSWTGLTIHDETDEDYIAIEADAGETISAEMTFADDEGDLDLELQDDAGLELAYSVSISDDESIEYTVEESGTYYVRAYGWAGATNEYDLSVTVTEDTGEGRQ